MTEIPLEYEYGYISEIICDNNNSTPMCSASITCNQCCTVATTTDNLNTVTLKVCDCSLDDNLEKTYKPELIIDDATTNNELSIGNSSCSTTVAALGALVGLLLVLLVIVTVVLVWTCQLLKRRNFKEYQMR